MINWNVIAQLISLGAVVLSGPAIIFFYTLREETYKISLFS